MRYSLRLSCTAYQKPRPAGPIPIELSRKLFGGSDCICKWFNTDCSTSVEAQLPATVYALGFILTYSIKPMSQVIFFWTMQHTKIYVISLLGKCIVCYKTLFAISDNSRSQL